MTFSLSRRCSARVLAELQRQYRPQTLLNPQCQHRRHFFNLFRRTTAKNEPTKPEEPAPILTEDNLVHPFSQSPFAQIQARGAAIKSLAPCPVCASSEDHVHGHSTEPTKTVQFECPDCGWPTHCSEDHWKMDKEHEKYCSRLREANEDEHDLRSGRRLWEFELPGPQGFEETVSFSNWDVFWYTRGHPSMDSERSRRHASKLLSFPVTIASVLHQYSYLTQSNQRLTPEGSRSMAALRSILHAPTGAPEGHEQSVGKPQVRIFVVGARAESSLPPEVWEQLGFLLPSANFHLFFIGPQVSLPKVETEAAHGKQPEPRPTATSELTLPDSTPNDSTAVVEKERSYVPNTYLPAVPKAIEREKWTRSSITRYGVPSYTSPYSYQMTLTGLQSNYMDVHHLFEDTLDPYSDCFFFFAPGFGFPSTESVGEDGKPLLQISSPTEWGNVLPSLLATKCPIFVTGFSPADVERDIKSLSTAPGVADEFEWVITPGPNSFSSEKWEVADFDPRVMIKANWGIWGIRGKSKEIQEKSFFDNLFTRAS